MRSMETPHEKPFESLSEAQDVLARLLATSADYRRLVLTAGRAHLNLNEVVMTAVKKGLGI